MQNHLTRKCVNKFFQTLSYDDMKTKKKTKNLVCLYKNNQQ